MSDFKLRYTSTTETLSDIGGPTYPYNFGATLHSFLVDVPQYSQTHRYHGTTQGLLQCDRLDQTRRDSMWTYYYTTLGAGYNAFTMIDHEKRMLFDTSWLTWAEEWETINGGVHRVTIDYQSPHVWTLPTYGAYLFASNSAASHNLDTGSDLTLDAGTLVDYATDNNVLRRSGYALRLKGDQGTSKAASGSVAWKSQRNGDVTIFGQFYATAVGATGQIVLAEMTNGSDFVRVSIYDGGASTIYIVANINNNSNASNVGFSSAVCVPDTWYDFAFTYNALSDHFGLYCIASNTYGGSFTNFLDGLTTIGDQIGTTESASAMPRDVKYTTCNLGYETVTGALADAEYVYLQNVMFMDGYISPVEFNSLRRLVNMWGQKDSGEWPK